MSKAAKSVLGLRTNNSPSRKKPILVFKNTAILPGKTVHPFSMSDLTSR